MEDLTTDLRNSKSIIRNYYKYTCKNLDEMSLFLENHQPPKLTQNKIDNLKNPKITEEIEFVV